MRPCILTMALSPVGGGSGAWGGLELSSFASFPRAPRWGSLAADDPGHEAGGDAKAALERGASEPGRLDHGAAGLGPGAPGLGLGCPGVQVHLGAARLERSHECYLLDSNEVSDGARRRDRMGSVRSRGRRRARPTARGRPCRPRSVLGGEGTGERSEPSSKHAFLPAQKPNPKSGRLERWAGEYPAEHKALFFIKICKNSEFFALNP